jgi:hypothetical protein
LVIHDKFAADNVSGLWVEFYHRFRKISIKIEMAWNHPNHGLTTYVVRDYKVFVVIEGIIIVRKEPIFFEIDDNVGIREIRGAVNEALPKLIFVKYINSCVNRWWPAIANLILFACHKEDR